jgi:transposase InsO family protein
VDRRIANCCLGSDRFRAPDKRGEAEAIARQACFQINRLLPVPYPAEVNCLLPDGFPHPPKIAQQLARSFGIELDKDVVRRVLATHYRPDCAHGGPSWLTLLGHAKDSLWSVDLFRAESIRLQTHWILLVMDLHTRRIIGFGGQAVAVDGPALCRMFNQAISGQGLPQRLSFDHDPLFEFKRWQAHLRVLDIESVRSVPYTPVSHPFIERLIGTVRREYLDRMFFWNRTDLERKLEQFKSYYNQLRVHQSLEGATPGEKAGSPTPEPACLDHYGWRGHCRGFFELPITA